MINGKLFRKEVCILTPPPDENGGLDNFKRLKLTKKSVFHSEEANETPFQVQILF